MSKRLVIALGGNALGKTPQEQLDLVKGTASTIVDLVEEGYDVVIGHGNGPQVGMVNLAFEYSANNGGGTPAMPFPECGAMTQGYIGYHLQQAVERELARRGINKPCAAVVTQVVVDKNDDAFQKPTKPVGMFYSKEDADRIVAETGYTFVEDAGRGYRRVVPSPIPVKIVELPIVEQLVGLHSVSAKLALDLNADMLVILTAVEKVSINFNKPDQKDLDRMTIAEAREYIQQGHFAPGSMLPKVESCISFVENTTGGTALITSLDKAREALQGKTGTLLVKE